MISPRILVLGTLLLTAFLAPGARAQSLPINEPAWPLEVLSWDLDKALPGVEYNYRVAARGGHYPYTFALLAGPTGMTIDARTGEIRWTPAAESTGHTVRLSITDSRGAILPHSFTVDADRAAFRFVATSGNNTTGDGSEAAPWATLAYASAHAGSTRYVYVKAGTYRETFTLDAASCGRLLAYPGDSVTVVGTGTGAASISLRGGSRMIFQGFTFDANDHRWLFSCDASLLENIVWRRNTMHNAYSGDWENPAFIFFWDGPQKPIEGQIEYRNIVMQENAFHDLRNPNDHGASTTLYNVQDLLYEDNHAYDIDGRGVSDKDDGFRNTFRNNIIHDCPTGLALWNQYSQGSIEIDHNLIYACDTAIVLGGQPGYLRDVFLHHNTILGSVFFSWVLEDPRSTNINLYRNIIASGASRPYSISPARIDEAGGGYHYDYPAWFRNGDPKVRIDGNLLWTTNTAAVAGFDWGIPATSWSGWHTHGYDLAGTFANPALDSQHALAPTSPFLGTYGRDQAPAGTDTYATWRAAHFTGADLTNDAISGPDADPDAAGVANFQRYVFALPARGPVADPITVDTANTAAGRVLTLTFPRRTTASGLTYILESSPDLITWLPVENRTFGPGSTPFTAEDIVPLDSAPRRFVRLRVTASP